MSQSIQVFIDVICPWCFIGKRRLDQALEQRNRAAEFIVNWLPYELDPSMPKAGADRKTYRTRRFGSYEKSQAMDANARSAGAEIGISFQYEVITRTPNTHNAHRLIWLFENSDMQSEVVDAIFRAYFLEGKDIGDTNVLADLASKVAGMDRQKALTFIAGDTGSTEVTNLQQHAREYGAEGVPFFVFNGTPHMGGADSITQLIRGFKV